MQLREQAGFQSGFSTMEYIQTVNQVIETMNENKEPPCLALIDYEKAFDLVETVAVLNAIQQQSVEEIHCRILEDIQRLHTDSRNVPIQKKPFLLLRVTFVMLDSKYNPILKKNQVTKLISDIICSRSISRNQ